MSGVIILLVCLAIIAIIALVIVMEFRNATDGDIVEDVMSGKKIIYHYKNSRGDNFYFEEGMLPTDFVGLEDMSDGDSFVVTAVEMTQAAIDTLLVREEP